MSPLFRLRMPSLFHLGLALLVVLGLSPVNPGVVFEVETTDHTGSRPAETITLSVEGPDLLKMEILPRDPNAGKKDEVIFRGDRGEMAVIDHQQRSFFVFDRATMDAMAGQIRQAQQAMNGMKIPDEVLQRMPEKERKRLEAMMKQQGAPPEAPRTSTEYRQTGERATHAGYPCLKYDWYRDDVRVGELWVTEWDNVEGGEEAAEVFKQMAAFFKEMTDTLGKAMGEQGFMGGRQDPFGPFLEVDGFPVVTRTFENGELDTESTLRSARRRTLDPADFEPPAGYKRMTMGPR